MKVLLRKFEYKDIETKIKWINNPDNNRYLHYDLPLEFNKTAEWFEKIKCRSDRYDAVIQVDGVAVGLIGFLSIDQKNKKAEYYVLIGEQNYKRKGIAVKASELLLEYAREILKLNKLYLFTETENLSAQKLFEKLGFEREGLLKQDLLTVRGYVDRYIYGLILKNDIK